MRISDWSSDVCSSDLGWNVEERRSFSVAGHVEEVVLPFIETLGEKPALVGYCLGGTMAMAAAALRDAMSVTTIAAPWRFSGFPAEARVRPSRLWQDRSEESRVGRGCGSTSGALWWPYQLTNKKQITKA